MKDRYFTVTLTNGGTEDFDKQCDEVKYSNNTDYCVFYHKLEGNKFIVLGIIPHNSIFIIKSHEKE